MTSIPPSLSAALAGTYRLERQLGQGGMAVVYLATFARGELTTAKSTRDNNRKPRRHGDAAVRANH